MLQRAQWKLHFICPDVGGGFGLRNNLYPEQAAILWAAKRIGRPVKWTNDRSESFLADYHGRDLADNRAPRTHQRRPHHGLSRRPRRRRRRPDRHVRAAEQRLSRRHDRLRHPADAHALPLGRHQHGADRAVPRRGTARGDAGAGAADRPRRGEARHGSRQNRAKEPDRAQEAALPHRQRPPLRQRRFHRQHDAHGRGRQLEELRGAAAQVQAAR